MERPRCAAALTALLVGGVVACTAATPSPTPASTTSPTAAPSARSSPSAPTGSSAPSPTPTERAASPSPNRLDLDIAQLDAEWIWPMLDFASDSRAVIYSSGVLDEAGNDRSAGTGAPDLWRYIPGQPEPELLWRNPDRERQLIKVAGDIDVWAFAEISSLGEPWWNLWLLTEPGGEPILLDAHPGDVDIPSLVPSFDVDAGRVAWTSFGRGATSGSVMSRLFVAEAPGWEPRLLAEDDASERAYWLPSMYGGELAYVDVTIGAGEADDVRHVMLLDFRTPGATPRQLDTSGSATMPVLTADAVIWKEPDVGFAMFNWGRLFKYTLETREVATLRIAPQEYVNYPSGGSRFVAMWGADSFQFAVHDLERGASRLIAKYDNQIDTIVRPHLAGDLLVWLHPQTDGLGNGPPAPIEYAYLPEPGGDRGE